MVPAALLLVLAARCVAAAAPSPSLWCPLYHNITGHYVRRRMCPSFVALTCADWLITHDAVPQDPSGPIFVDGVWHVFPDGNGKGGGKGWSHFMSVRTPPA
jgi:hypothetical protein